MWCRRTARAGACAPSGFIDSPVVEALTFEQSIPPIYQGLSRTHEDAVQVEGADERLPAQLAAKSERQGHRLVLPETAET